MGWTIAARCQLARAEVYVRCGQAAVATMQRGRREGVDPTTTVVTHQSTQTPGAMSFPVDGKTVRFLPVLILKRGQEAMGTSDVG